MFDGANVHFFLRETFLLDGTKFYQKRGVVLAGILLSEVYAAKSPSFYDGDPSLH